MDSLQHPLSPRIEIYMHMYFVFILLNLFRVRRDICNNNRCLEIQEWRPGGFTVRPAKNPHGDFPAIENGAWKKKTCLSGNSYKLKEYQ
jgi:hypothetical protein